MEYRHLGRSGLLVSAGGLGCMNVGDATDEPVVSTLIAGSRTKAQFEAAVDALNVELDADALAELDRIWPGPGVAPRSYAW